MSPVKLYGMSVSTCTRRCQMALEEKNVAYELINVDLMKGEHKQPEFLTKQPFGKIPVLVDGDVQIFESRAIIRYIAKKWAGQGTDLLGKDAQQQALTENWLEVESQNYNGPVSTIVAEKVFKKWGGQEADEAVVASKLEELSKVLDVYEARLSKSAYLAGPEFSLADLSHLPYTHYLIHAAGLSEPINKRPAVKAWWDNISSRPAWTKLTAQ